EDSCVHGCLPSVCSSRAWLPHLLVRIGGCSPLSTHQIRVVPYGNQAVTCHDSVVNRSWRTVGTARAGAAALGALGAAFGLLTLAEARSAPGGSFGGTSWAGALSELAAGFALIAAGMAESWRKPASRGGLLLAAAGIGWFFTDWNNPGLGSPAAFTF